MTKPTSMRVRALQQLPVFAPECTVRTTHYPVLKRRVAWHGAASDSAVFETRRHFEVATSTTNPGARI